MHSYLRFSIMGLILTPRNHSLRPFCFSRELDLCHRCSTIPENIKLCTKHQASSQISRANPLMSFQILVPKPLKTDKTQKKEKTDSENTKVSFIGLSNWSLDSAKMNRAVLHEVIPIHEGAGHCQSRPW